MQKIIVITTSFPKNKSDYSGLFVYRHIKYINKKTIVIAPHEKGLKEYEKYENIEIYRIKYAPEKFETLFYGQGVLENIKNSKISVITAIPWIFLSTYKAINLLKNNDILITHWAFPTGISGSFIKLIKKDITHINIIHSAGITLLKKYKLKAIAKFLYKYTDKIQFVNKEHIKWFELLIEKKTENKKIILKPMPVEFYKSTINGNKKNILYIGRIIKIKGLNQMLDELRDYSKQKVIIAGNGNLKNKLEKKYKFADFTGNVYGKKKEELLKTSKYLIIPSITDKGQQEGFPGVILEGALNGTILIISKYVKGIDYLYKDRINCLYYDPYIKGDLTEKLEYAEKNEKKIKKIIKISYDTAYGIIESYKIAPFEN